MDGTGSPDHVFPAPKESLHWIVPSPSPQAVYICTYSVPQSSFLHLASIAQAREGERPCQSGPNPQSAPPLPASLASGPAVSPTPETPGAGGSKQELGLPYFAHQIEFLFCIVFLWPMSESRAGEKDRFMQLFSYIPSSEWGGGSPPRPSPSTPTHLLGECLCMFPSLWWEIV